MEKYFAILLLVGVACAAGPAPHSKKGKIPATAAPLGANAGGDHPNADAKLQEIHHHLMQRLHEIETNKDLTERQKKQQLAGLGQEMKKFVSAMTGVPVGMIDHPLSNEDAEKLRQQFLASVHEILINHEMSFEEKKTNLEPLRAEYADGIRALGLHSPEKHKAAVGQEKLMRSRAHADVMTKLLHSIKNGDGEQAKHQLKQSMVQEMRMLHQKYGKSAGRSASRPDSGSDTGPSHPRGHPVHHKKKHASRK